VKEVVFANGHEAEDRIRPLVARDFDTEFQPKVFMLEGLTPLPLSVSLDGLCAFGDYNLEVKQFNQELFESVKNGVVPEDRMPQLQQQLMLSPAKQTIFAVSNEAMNGYVHVIVNPDDEFIYRIPAIWQGFWDGVQNFTEFETFDLVPKSASEVTTPEFAINGGALSIRSNITAWNNGILSRYNSLPVNIEADSFPQFKETKDILDAGAKLLKIRIKELEKQAEPLIELIKQYKSIQKDLSSKASSIDGQMSDFRRAQRMIHVNKAGEEYFSLQKDLSESIPNNYFKFALPLSPDFYGACNRCQNNDSVASAVESALDAAKIELKEWHENVISKNQLIDSLQDANFKIVFVWIEPYSKLTNEELEAEFNRQKQRKIDAAELQKLREKQQAEQLEQARIAAEEKAKAEREAAEKLKADIASAVEKLEQEAKPIEQPAEQAQQPIKLVPVADKPVGEIAKQVAETIQKTSKLKPNREALILVVADSMQVDKITAEAWLLAAFTGATAESLHKQACDYHESAAHADKNADYKSEMAVANKYYALAKALSEN
jgi:predicted phage-related endonuclease